MSRGQVPSSNRLGVTAIDGFFWKTMSELLNETQPYSSLQFANELFICILVSCKNLFLFLFVVKNKYCFISYLYILFTRMYSVYKS